MNDLMTKSFMSYVDLKKAAMKDLEAGGDGVELPEVGVTDERLKGFFQETEAVEEEMAAIRDALARLNAANEEGKSLHQPDALRALRGRVNADIIAVLRRARDIRARLEAMDRANAAQRRLSAGCREGTRSTAPAPRSPPRSGRSSRTSCSTSRPCGSGSCPSTRTPSSAATTPSPARSPRRR